VPSAVGLGVLVDRDYSVKQAGGFIVQLMPFAEEEVIRKLEENLSKVSSVTKLLEDGMSNEEILNLLLEGLEPEITEETRPEFACNCGNGRVEKALITLGKQELGKMLEDKEPIEVHCDFCNSTYTYSVEDLKKLYQRAK
jgi:molecular chaperone Hsp33